MLPNGVRHQADTLRRALVARGWNVVEVESPFEDEWWAAEIWVIESDSSPRGRRAYLTFLIDPQGGREEVWAVWAKAERPAHGDDGTEPFMRLRNVWQQELPGFLQGLNRFRAGARP
jgi:hypothetical protein